MPLQRVTGFWVDLFFDSTINLIALCDQLEQQLHQAGQQRRRLLEALLAEALREPVKALEGIPA